MKNAHSKTTYTSLLCIIFFPLESWRAFFSLKLLEQSEVRMKGFFHFLLVAVVSILCGCTQRIDLSSHRIIDLTHSFDEQTIYLPTEKSFVFEKGFEGITQKGYFYTANLFRAPEHGGTRIDASIHFYKGRRTVDAISLDRLIARAVVIGVSASCEKKRDYQVQIDDVLAREKVNGELPKGVIVLLRTGFIIKTGGHIE